MKKFRLNNKDPKQLSKEDIAKYKDFASVAHGYQSLTKRRSKRLYQDPKFFMFLFLILLILLILYIDSRNEKGQEKNTAPTEQIDEITN